MLRANFIFLTLSVLVIAGTACSSTNKSGNFTPAPNFDKSNYINPDKYVKGELYDADHYSHIAFDSTFTPASAQDVKEIQYTVNYPAEARRKGIQGVVVLKIYVDSTGTLTNLEPVKSPHKMLSEASKNAADQGDYQAATLHGNPVNSFFYMPVFFQVYSTSNSNN